MQLPPPDPAAVEAITALVMVGVLGTFTLLGLKAWWSHKTERLKLQRGGGAGELTETVDQMRDQLLLLRDDVAELHERLDFAERLVTQQRADSPQLKKPDRTPV
jgi:hypothetical protein